MKLDYTKQGLIRIEITLLQKGNKYFGGYYFSILDNIRFGTYASRILPKVPFNSKNEAFNYAIDEMLKVMIENPINPENIKQKILEHIKGISYDTN